MNNKIPSFDEYIVKSILANNQFNITQINNLKSLKSLYFVKAEYTEIEKLILTSNIEKIKLLPYSQSNNEGSSFVPVTGGAYEQFNPGTGRRVDGNWRNGFQQRPIANSYGNTLAQNFSSQTSTMAKILSKRLGANISAAYNYANPGSCRYKFQGNIQRTIVTWKWK